MPSSVPADWAQIIEVGEDTWRIVGHVCTACLRTIVRREIRAEFGP